MAAAREVVGYVATSTGLALESSVFAPSWVFVKTIIFTISTALAVFDTYTDWEVVLNFRETGLNNPLLLHNEHWTRAWFLFATIGTILIVTSILHEGTVLIYSIYKSCQKICCNVSCRCCKNRKASLITSSRSTASIFLTDDLETQTQTDSNTLVSSYELVDLDSQSDESEVEVKEDKDEISDPFKCCFRHGWNVTTRNETLGAITLWFQDIPMLTMAVLLAWVQNTCKTPDTRDVSPILQSVGISATASTLASTASIFRTTLQ